MPTEVNAKISVDFSWTSDNALLPLLMMMLTDSKTPYWLERLCSKIRIPTTNIFCIKYTGKKMKTEYGFLSSLKIEITHDEGCRASGNWNEEEKELVN